jgi:prepilin signal peptidase PulO-like enzyme (type II secretory pathway)
MLDLTLITLISLAFGSFANNVISYYINSNTFDLLYSTCFCGKKRLEWFELIPVLSYFLQKGKCTECKNKISFRYPLVEILTLTIALIVYFFSGVETNSIVIFFILYTLLIISVIDVYKLIIPNLLTIILLMLSIIYLIENSYSILDRIVYSTVLAIILFGISYFYEKYKNKIVIGAGDIKLIFVLSLLLNVIDSMLALWVSSLIGLLAVVLFNIKDFSNLKTIKIPFGLYLSIGFTIVYLWNLKTGSVELESMLLSLWQMK